MNPIVKWVMQTMMKGQTGVMRTLPDRKLLDLNVNMTVERLIRNGIDPSTIKTPGQLDNIIKQIEQPRVIPADSKEGKKITDKLLGKKGEVVDMTGKKIDTSQGIMGGKSVKELMKSSQVQKSNKTDVEGIIKNIKKLSPMDAMKEANLVIGRKNYYKNLTPEESKKILQDTEDHIFERDIIPDPEDMADGGVAGLLGERPGYNKGKSFAQGGPARPGYANGNGVADEDAEKAALGKRVRDLMDDGYDFGEAVKKAMEEGYADGGRIGFQVGGSPAIDARMQNTRAQNIKNIGDLRLQNTRAQNIATNEAQRANNLRMRNMRGMGKSGFQTQSGTLNQGIENVGNQLGVDTSGIQSGVDRVQNIIMNQAPNRFADYLSGRTEPVTDLSEIASTQSTRDIINQGILGSLERNQITNPTGSFNTVVQSKGGGGEYASNRPVDYSGYKLGNPLPGIKNYAAEVGQVLNTMGGNAENQIANTLGDYSFEYRPPSYDFDDDYMGIKDIYDFKGKSGEGGGTPYDVNVELTDADTKQKIREQLFKDAAEPSAMPQGSPGQLNPTPTPDAGTIKLPQQGEPGGLITDGGNSYKINEDGMTASLVNQKPTMADVAGPTPPTMLSRSDFFDQADSWKEWTETSNKLQEEERKYYENLGNPGGSYNPDSQPEYLKNLRDKKRKLYDQTWNDYYEYETKKNKEFKEYETNLASGGPARQNFKMGKRAFLKLMGGVGAGIAGLKSGLLGFGKGATKKAVKELTSVPIGNPEGMPAWFKPLVNKIIKEGDDVTKKFGTVDREIVHTKKIDDFEEVTVYQDLNTGNVRMEYGPHLTDDTGKVIRASNEPTVVQLEYKAPEMIEPDITTGKGGGKTKEEFYAAESEPEIVNWDGDIEMSGINEVNKVDDLITDTSKLQKYATDNKLTIKELSDSMKKQKYKNKLDSDLGEQVNYIENKSGMNAMDYIDEGTRVGDFDPKGYRNYDTKGINLPEKKSDGGLAAMLGE